MPGEQTGNADALAIKGWIKEEGCRKLFAAAGMDFDAAFEAAKKPGFKAFSLNLKCDVDMDVAYNVKQTNNVGGILEGTDLKDECVVFNAHWDHLGIGTPDARGDSIYNGASDNASAMAALLLSVKKARELPATRRSLVFLSVSSEESGLFGSQYYCEHPAIAMDKTVACINYESVGPAELTHDVNVMGGQTYRRIPRRLGPRRHDCQRKPDVQHGHRRRQRSRPAPLVLIQKTQQPWYLRF